MIQRINVSWISRSTGAIIVAFLVVLLTSMLERTSIDVSILFITIVFAIYAIVILKFEFAKGELASPLSFYAVLMLAHFLIPSLFILFDLLDFVYEDNQIYFFNSIVFVLLSFFFFHLGYSIVAFNISKRGKEYIWNKKEWDTAKTKLIVLSLLCLGWLARFIIIKYSGFFQITRGIQGELEGPFYAVIRLMEFMPLHAIIIACIFFWTTTNQYINKKLWTNFIISIIILDLAYWLPTGNKESVILLIILPIIIRYILTHRLPSKKITLFITVFIFFLFPTTFFYRNAMLLNDFSSMPLFERIQQAFAEGFFMINKNDLKGMIILSRMNLIEPVSACIRLIESGIWDLSFGKEYFMILVNLIPRIFWSGKPDFHYGTEFGYQAGYLDISDTTTSISVTFIGEAFLNFWWFGALCMSVFGGLFSFIYKRSTLTLNPISILLYILTIPVILYIGGTAAGYFGGLFKILLIYYVIGHFMLINQKREV